MNDDAKHSAGANSDMHERARMMIALSAPEGFSDAGLGEGLSHDERVWVAGHLESCARCREFAENSREAVLGLRRHGVTASGSLISQTQVRVRQRAEELKRQQERLWVVSACCAAVALGTTVSTAVLWRGFEWMGQQARLSLMLWACGFVLLSLMPSVLAGIVLLARGTYFSDHEASHQE
jgi:hypothetical protein